MRSDIISGIEINPEKIQWNDYNLQDFGENLFIF